MRPRVKKALGLAVKLVVVAVLADYARRHAQLDDEIAVVTPADDGPLRAPAGTRLAVIRTASASRTSYLARTPHGELVEIPATEVATGPLPGTPDDTGARNTAPFTLLPGLHTLFAALRWGHVAAAFAAFGPALMLMTVRWDVLLRANAIRIPFLTLVRLNYLGFFYNAFMPGSAGGDVVKAVYLARHCTQKTEAATLVLVDRIVGLLGLVAVAGAVVLLEATELNDVAQQIGICAFVLALGTALYFSAPFRRLIRYDALIAHLPRADMFKRIDGALYGLRHRKKALAIAFGLTLALQLLEIVGVSWAGDAIGLHHARLAHYLVFVPIGFLVNALPISFGGIGLMEGAYMKLFHDAGVATATQGFMLGVLTRLIVLGWSALGAFSALFPPQPPDALPTAELA